MRKARLNWIYAYHNPVGLTLTFNTHLYLFTERILCTRPLINAVTSLHFQSLPSNSAGNQGAVRNLRNIPNSSSKRLWAFLVLCLNAFKKALFCREHPSYWWLNFFLPSILGLFLKSVFWLFRQNNLNTLLHSSFLSQGNVFCQQHRAFCVLRCCRAFFVVVGFGF